MSLSQHLENSCLRFRVKFYGDVYPDIKAIITDLPNNLKEHQFEQLINSTFKDYDVQRYMTRKGERVYLLNNRYKISQLRNPMAHCESMTWMQFVQTVEGFFESYDDFGE